MVFLFCILFYFATEHLHKNRVIPFQCRRLPPNCRRLPSNCYWYPPTAISCPPSSIGCPPTALCHPPAAVGYLTTARLSAADAAIFCRCCHRPPCWGPGCACMCARQTRGCPFLQDLVQRRSQSRVVDGKRLVTSNLEGPLGPAGTLAFDVAGLDELASLCGYAPLQLVSSLSLVQLLWAPPPQRQHPHQHPPPRDASEGTSEAASEVVRKVVGGGCQSGWGRLLLVTNAIETGTSRQGASGWAWAGRPLEGGG